MFFVTSRVSNASGFYLRAIARSENFLKIARNGIAIGNPSYKVFWTLSASVSLVIRLIYLQSLLVLRLHTNL